MNPMTQDDVRRALEQRFSKLPKKVQETAQWWIKTDETDHSNPLISIAIMYRHEFRLSLPGPNGSQPPAFVDREIEEIQRAFRALMERLSSKLSKEACAALINSGEGYEWARWMPVRVLGDISDPSIGEQLRELKRMASLPLVKTSKGGRRPPLHSTLIRWAASRLRGGSKPRSHVVPLARCIHEWAAEENVSTDWGNEPLKKWWPPKPKEGE